MAEGNQVKQNIEKVWFLGEFKLACSGPASFVQFQQMTRPIAAPAGSHRPFYRQWAWWCTLVVLVLIACIRLRLLEFPLERDEGEYAYTGQLMLQGVPPYHLVYNMKFPGTYAAYAVIMALFGQTPAGIHLGVLCVTTLTALMLYGIGRRWVNEPAGIVAATTYAALAASPQLLGLAGHATHFCALFVTAGLCFLWPVGRNLNWKNAVAGGFLFGLAVLMKQHAAVFCLWGLGVLVVNGWRQYETSAAKRLLPCAAFCFGVALPLLLTGLILWHAGVFGPFWFWTISYAGAYVSEVPWSLAPRLFFHGVSQIIPNTILLWLVAAAGLGLVWWPGRFRTVRLPLSSLVVISFLAVCPGFYFRMHYFLLMLPAVALCAAWAVNAVDQLWLQSSSSAKTISWPVRAYGLVLAVTIFANRETWFQATPAQAAAKIYGGNPFTESEMVSAFIRTNSPPGARVAVLGSEPQIYFLSHRHAATGYIYMYPLMEPQLFADRMQQEMIREIEAADPEYVVTVLVAGSWLPRPESDTRLLDWWSQAYVTNFTLAGVVVMDPPRESRYFLGPNITNYQGLPDCGLAIFQRKALK